MPSRWHVRPADPVRAAALARAAGVDPVTAQLLLNRGVRDHVEAARFFHPDLRAMEDPQALPDLARGVARLRQAVARQEPILIFGDSDVDGLTASAILYEVLKQLGGVVRVRLANRPRDGYGLPPPLARQLARSRVTLLILVDCGTNQAEMIHALARHGIDTIVVDHHVPLGPGAHPTALINPHRAPGQGGGLCSAGVALKVAQALLGTPAEPYVDLAALGTLADCAPLVGENRTIVSEGLPRIAQTRRPGLQRLCEATRTASTNPEQITRRLVPRLNASGRLGDATPIWHLLLQQDTAQGEAWMAQAETAHARTKRLHRQIAAEAHEQVHRMHFKDQAVVVVSRDGWHQGLMGPLASQLVQQYQRPAIAIALDARQGVGSGRSAPSLNLLRVLEHCQGLLVRFGGHAQACGLTVSRRNLEPFRALVNQQARGVLEPTRWVQVREADVELPLSAVHPRWVSEVDRLAPFGRGNERPTVVVRNLTLEIVSPRVGRLGDGSTRVAARGRLEGLLDGGCYDVMAIPAVVDGQVTLTVSDVRVSTAP